MGGGQSSRRRAITRAERAEMELRELREAIAREEVGHKRAEEARIREEAANRNANEARKQAEEARAREEQAIRDARKQAEEARVREEQASHDAAEVRKQAEEARAREEQAIRDATEARQQAEENRSNAEKAEKDAQDARQRSDEALKNAEQDRLRVEEQNQSLESQIDQVKTYLRKGIQPVEYPTAKEFNDAKERVQYRADRIHFAVCGFSGTGKSSLINAVRGLTNQDDGAATTGVTETTMTIGRYTDYREEDPFPRFVWLDVPGGGGAKVTDWQYFNQQGLFIFDMIIVVYADRVTKLDVSILDNCRRYKIPAFIVRSKADHHIRQIMKDMGYSKARRWEKEKLYTDACNKLINVTRSNMEETLSSYNLPPQQVYITSSETLYGLSTGNPVKKILDEQKLIQDVLQVACNWRYDAPERHTRIVDQCVAAASQDLRELHF